MHMFYLKILHRINSDFLWFLYSYKSKKILPRSLFILSFDCDTEEDIAVALDVHTKLQDMGITPVYAVPGELLKKGEKTYRKIHSTGAEFINHGGREHTYFDQEKKRHASCFFYDQESENDLKEDIILGHQTIQNVLGFTPKGWRTPHFGTFQKPEHLQFLYNLLKELDYNFSTSTSPIMSYLHGPLLNKNGIIEIPVTGIFSEPLNIMDTWAYFAAPDRTKSYSGYVRSARLLADFSKKSQILINIYGDPSHIHDKPEFFQAMELLVKASQNVNYTELLGIAHENIRNI